LRFFISDIIADRFGLTEFNFMVDGSPDTYALLRDRYQPLVSTACPAHEFGSLAAIRTGLLAGRGAYFGVTAADLQEPPELLVDFLGPLAANAADIVVGRREGREDPAATRISANLFWRFYRIFVNPEIPPGGVDIFGCSRQVRDELVRLEESHSSLVGLLFWVGFRRHETPYLRRARAYGRSSWTFRKKFTYLLDSVLLSLTCLSSC
jgi:hypothetical protein